MTILEIIAIVVVTVLAGFFAMAEFSIVSSRRSRLEQLAAKGHRGARIAIEIADNPIRFLAVIQVGTTLSTMLVGTLSGAILAVKLATWLADYAAIRPYSTTIAITVLIAATTWLSMVLAELVPKQLALNYPEAIAARVALPLSLLVRAAVPILWVLDSSSSFFLRLMRVRPTAEQAVTEEDIHSIVAEGAKLGVIHHLERDMIEGVLDLADSPVRSIMTPRPRIAWIDVKESGESVLSKIASCPYAQMLVCRDSLDEVIGFVRKQDLLDQYIRGEPIDIERAARSPLILSEVTSILRTLDRFRSSPVNEALVVDEFGTIQGIVTRTDLLESVAGDLAKVEGEIGPKVTRRGDDSFLIDAAMPIDEVAKLLDVGAMPSGDFVTLWGFVLSQLGHMPQRGEGFSWNNWDFSVMELDGGRAGRLLVERHHEKASRSG
jgi:putative hemolysin